QLAREPGRHRLVPALTRVADDPTDRERGRATRPDLDGHLVGGTADATAAHLERGPDVLDRALERGDGIAARLALDVGKRVVNDALRGRALAALQDLVDELRDDDRPEHRVGDELATLCGTFTRHVSLASRRSGYGPACGSRRPRRRARRARPCSGRP